MVPLSLSDTIEANVAERDSLDITDLELSRTENNLVTRAVTAFRRRTGRIDCYRIYLTKRIPIGAGLGGGSSDAAATLRLLNQLHEQPLKAEELLETAAELGSDVAFFLAGDAAWCVGRGEKVSLREFAEGLWITLTKPGFSVPTGEAYQLFERAASTLKRGASAKTEWGMFRNDLEPAVFRKYPLLAVIKEWLQKQPESILSMMSGSGSTTFSLTRDEASANTIQSRFLSEFGPEFWTCVCQVNPG
jgi:4-diphosphocytidyl-2-C-methyl-D-erythritol kinase